MWGARREIVENVFSGPTPGGYRAQIGAVGDLSKIKFFGSRGDLGGGTPYVTRYDPLFPGRPDPKLSIDTTKFVNPKDKNAAGFPRDAGKFWKEWIELNPQSISSSNRYLIENYNSIGRSPVVDKVWIQAFPEHVNFPFDTLLHHHVDHGRYAIPVPQTTHMGSGGVWLL